MNRPLTRSRIPFHLILLILLSAPLHAQQESDLVILEHADSLIGREVDGEKVRELVGNVRFTHGSLLVNCRRAIQYLTSNRIELTDEVAIRDDSLTLLADRGSYFGATKTAEAFGRVRLDDGVTYVDADYGRYHSEIKKAYFKSNVFVRDTSLVLTADEVSYLREEEQLFADGNVVVHNQANRITIRGGHLESNRRSGYSIVTERPRAVQVDSASDGPIDSLVVTCREIESFRDSVERLVATDSAVIIRGGFAAECGQAVLFTKLDSIELWHKPFAWYTSSAPDTTQVSGDSMSAVLFNRRIRTLYVRGSAVAISQADSAHPERFHQMTGETLVMGFVEGEVGSIAVNTTSTLLYYLFDEGKPNGANRTTGDRVRMEFHDRKIRTINVAGGVEGKYIPERLLAGREKEYNLDGFNWRMDRPRVLYKENRP